MALVGLSGARPGSAEATTSIVSVDFGQPIAEIATTITAHATVDSLTAGLFIKTRSAGGPACAPTDSSDPGSYAPGFGISGTAEAIYPTGDTTKTTVVTFGQPGTYQWCAWLTTNGTGGIPAATASGIVAVASPTGRITSVSAPAAAPKNRTFIVTVSGTSQVSRNLIWRLRPAGEPPCATSPALDPGTAEFQDEGDVLGAFTKRLALQVSSYGRYRLCGWVAASDGDTAALGVNETKILAPAPKRTLMRVSASPRVVRRGDAVRVTALVFSSSGSPAGTCSFDRLVRHRWKPYATVRFTAGKACRAKIHPAGLGATLFRVRYSSSNGFPRKTAFSGQVLVTG